MGRHEGKGVTAAPQEAVGCEMTIPDRSVGLLRSLVYPPRGGVACECCEVTPARQRVELEGSRFELCPGCEGLLLGEATR